MRLANPRLLMNCVELLVTPNQCTPCQGSILEVGYVRTSLKSHHTTLQPVFPTPDEEGVSSVMTGEKNQVIFHAP